MSIVTNSSLLLATETLRHRLVRPTNIGANILDPDKVFQTNIEDNFGRFIGCFAKRSNVEPCFLLFARSDPIDTIDYLFIFYLRHNYSRIQPSELKLLKEKFSRLSKIDISIINVHSEAPQTCNLSILLQAVEFSINPSLMSDFVSRQDLKVGEVSSLVCFNANIPFPNCNLSTFCPDTENICKFMKGLNLKIIPYKDRPIPNDFNILVASNHNHLVYVIHYTQIKSMMLLLPHNSQFKSQRDASKFLDDLKSKLLPYKPKYFGATRYYGALDTFCNSRELLKACIFLVTFGNNLINVVKQSDVDSVLSDDRIDKAIKVAEQIIEESRSELIPESLSDANSTETESATCSYDDDNDDIRVTNIRCDAEDGDAEVLSVRQEGKSSQETIIMTNKQILDEFRRNIDDYDAHLNSSVPPVPEIRAQTDMKGEILNSSALYFNGLDIITDLWHKYTSVYLVTLVSTEFIRESGFSLDHPDLQEYRFIVLPISDDNFDMIVIIDKERDEWVTISPDNEAAKDHEVFGEIESIAGKICKPLKDMISWPIMITSSFHRQFPKVHLIMSLFYLAKLFKYCPSLPKKLIYGERDFRWYCYEVCYKLQLSNNEYNMNNNLIKKNGGLKKGALKSILIPIYFERSVVPKGQCPYCLKRDFLNLANHITMKHRGQSDICHKLRRSQK